MKDGQEHSLHSRSHLRVASPLCGSSPSVALHASPLDSHDSGILMPLPAQNERRDPDASQPVQAAGDQETPEQLPSSSPMDAEDDKWRDFCALEKTAVRRHVFEEPLVRGWVSAT